MDNPVHTDKDTPATAQEPMSDGIESAKENTLNWLLELDRDEPEENLFVVDRSEPLNQRLSAIEAEIAARPMVRGRAGADDFDTYVAEEIVISSEGGSGDIYTETQVQDVEGNGESFDEAMALDFTHRDAVWADVEHSAVEDGADILGLDEDDDSGIGDAFLVVKRSARPEKMVPVPAAASFEDTAQRVAAAVDPRVAPLMDELHAALAARLESLGQPRDAVGATFLLAADASGQEQAVAQGYANIAAICPQTPDALDGLDAEQLGAVYLRLSWAASGETCNDIFVREMANDAPAGQPPVLEVVDNSVFDEELLLEDFETGFSPDAWTADEPDGAADILQVFDEDMFASEPGEETPMEEAVSQEDLDTFFDDFGEPAGSEDEICGVSVAEFAETGAAEVFEEAPPAGAVEPPVDADLSWCIPADIQFSHSSPSSGEIFAEFLDAFIEEGGAELEKLEDAVTRWENDPGDEAVYTEVTRVLHTIKGIAKGVGLHFYGTLIHNFETLLDRLAKPDAEGRQHYFRIVNAWLDAAVRGMEHIQAQRVDIASEFPQRPGGQAAPVEQPSEPAQSESVAVEEQAAAEPSAEACGRKVQAAPAAAIAHRRKVDKQLADEGARALAAQQSVRITSEKLDLLLNLANQAQQLGVRTAQSTARNKRNSAELQARLSSVRTHIADIADRALFNVSSRGAGHSAELDALEMDQYSEIQEAANILREGVEDLADLIEIASRNNAQAEALLKQQATVISSIGSSIRAARVVPVSRLMPGLRRLVRTVSNDLDKEVAFRVANEVGTLDRDDYARCQTILEHMVRNALDHGIETAAERREAGKPSVGQITVDIRMAGADSVIVLSDDGRGIDPEKMREAALQKGLDVDAEALSDEEALALIFHKGFSTARSLSQISGRGVGMDIVLSELQEMGGDVRIESEVGKGTSFHIRIPSNVTVNGALLVTAGDNSYAIPLGGLIAVEQVAVDDFFDAVASGETLRLSGLDCEPAYLGTLCKSGNLPDKSSWRATVPVIIAGSEQRYMAIAIDDVEEALELVIRSLGAQFAAVPGVAGAATTADGEAVVALDLNVLVACFAEGQGTAVTVDQPEDDRFLALVVDDSRTQRMVATSQLETVGVETATAENGAVAIDWLNTTEQLPDVILLDVEMPVKDGIQTLREIRKSARYSHVPVIMVTSRTGLKHRTLAEEAGCNGYMGKPFNFRMLIGQINSLTGHRLELD